MNRTEYTSQGVEELRASLLDLFEDEDGAIAKANKKQLVEFSKDNWDYIDSVINAVEEEPDAVVAESEDEDLPEEAVEEAVVEDEEPDLSKPNPKTDLYTGRFPG